jgi:hypothetical protein
MPSTSGKQARFMAMIAHDKGAAKRTGVPQSVAKEFNRADAKTGILRRKKKKGGNGENTADQEEP